LYFQGLLDGKHNRPLGAMLVRYLIEGEKRRLRKGYEKMARMLDKGRNPDKAFRSVFGPPKGIEPRFLAWLRTAQEPWTPIFNEWERIGPGRFLGRAKGVTSACRLKNPAESLRATLEVPGTLPGPAGLLLHFEDRKNFTVAFIDKKMKFSVRRMEKGRWKVLGSTPCPPLEKADRIRFHATRKGNGVTVSVEGKSLGPFTLPGEIFGLALQRCAVRFRDVSWKDGK
jgi:hypothetical protein